MNNKFNGRDIRNQSQYQTSKFSGMKDGTWELTFSVIDFVSDLMKAVMVVGGVISMNLADITFGAVAISILFGGFTSEFYGVSVFWIGLLISTATSGINIYLWSLLKKRNIGLKDILNFNKLDKDIRTFLFGAMLMSILDTVIDVSPIGLLVKNSPYKEITWLYWTMVGCITLLVIIICGFSEPLTANMKEMLMMTHSNNKNNNNGNRQNNFTPENFKNNKPYVPESDYQITQKTISKYQPQHKPINNNKTRPEKSDWKQLEKQHRESLENPNLYRHNIEELGMELPNF